MNAYKMRIGTNRYPIEDRAGRAMLAPQFKEAVKMMIEGDAE